MTGMAVGKDTDFEDSAEEDTQLKLQMLILPSQKPEDKQKDHCDYLLDALDEQLNQLQPQSSFKIVEDSRHKQIENSATDLEQAHRLVSQEPRHEHSTDSSKQTKECKKEEYKWRLSHLLGSEQTDAQEYHSDSNSTESVCTEDFVMKFKKGMIDPVVSGGNDENTTSSSERSYGDHKKTLGDIAEKNGKIGLQTESTSEDHVQLNTARREIFLQKFKEELQAALSFSDSDQAEECGRKRRDSLESLGGRISRLSHANISEPSSLLSFGKGSSVVSHLSSKSADDSQKGLGSKDDYMITTQPIYSNTLESAEASMKTLQETKNESLLEIGLNQTRKNNQGTQISHQISGTVSVHNDHNSLENYKEEGKTENIRSSWQNKDWGSESEIPGASQMERLENSQKCSYVKYSMYNEKNIGGSQELSSKVLIDETAAGTLLSRDATEHPESDKICAKQEREAYYPKEQASWESNFKPGLSFKDKADTQTKIDVSLTDERTGIAQYKHVAGIPLKSFDAVTVDSDLDTVTTERVRDHIRKALGSKKDPTQNTKRVHRQRSELLRYSSNVTTDDEEKEEYQKSYTERRNRSPKRWHSTPQAAESTWEHSVSSLPPDLMSIPDLGQHHRLLEDLTREKVHLEEYVTKLRRDIVLEEERLAQRKSQHRDVDESFNDALQQKKEAYLELESMQDLLDQTQKEVVKMESRLRENQITSDEFRNELAVLEYKRSECLKNLHDLELELEMTKQQCSSAQNSQIVSLQYEISSLTSERDELKSRLRNLEGSISFLERQELERQLTSTKSELFSEQRTARVRTDKLQENLEESQCKLEDKTTECVELQEKNKQLKSQLRELEKKYESKIQSQAEEASEEKDALNQHVTDLTSHAREQNTKVTSLEKILSEKELELMKLRDIISTLKADKEAQTLASDSLKEQQNKRVMELQLQHQQDKDMHITKLKEELESQKLKDLQQLAENMEQAKMKALQGQAEALRKETDKVVKSLEAKDKEITKLKEAVKSQKDSMKKLAVELKQEAREMVHNTLLREQKKWEKEKMDALQIQKHTLEEERLRDMADLREALERERRTNMMLEKKSADLQNIIQEHEVQNRSLQREKQDALDELRAVLKDENQEDMKRLQQELAKERERDMERLKFRMHELEEEHHVLRAEKNEAVFREREALAQADRAEKVLAREISTVSERIQNAMGRTRIHSPSHNRHGSPSRLSTNQALQMLHGVCDETNQLVHDLQQEVEAQKRTVLHVQREKERELHQQKEQLQLEREKSLELMKERLIQEHIEEITNLQRDQLRDSSSAESQSLRQQLREKDNELRAIQRNMGKWKDETAAKLARKFEEELNVELEKSLSRSKASESHRYTERVGPGMRRLSVQEGRENSHLRSSSTSSLNVVGAQHDFGALKILRNLQGRVKELRTDNRLYHGGSMEDLNLLRTDLGSPYKQKKPLMTERSMAHLKGTIRK
ncbi:trichohyalin isoform X3 [Xenopus laevis]|uniref:Uncharacterized protein n=2 Tax=Xenopus laevis TaxID=8355 RepID=A0A974E3B3_XENLA|nr:trichohyalin isoform X3 [Xenopus laevis]OCU02162.1 hypothetical protein XELAEV_18007923mg [Xenopus laevis]